MGSWYLNMKAGRRLILWNTKALTGWKPTGTEASGFSPIPSTLNSNLSKHKTILVLHRKLLRRVFYGIENALEGAVRSIQSDIRFMLRTVPKEKPKSSVVLSETGARCQIRDSFLISCSLFFL